MTPTDLQTLLLQIADDVPQAARVLRLSQWTLYAYRSGARPVPAEVAALVRFWADRLGPARQRHAREIRELLGAGRYADFSRPAGEVTDRGVQRAV